MHAALFSKKVGFSDFKIISYFIICILILGNIHIPTRAIRFSENILKIKVMLSETPFLILLTVAVI